MAGILFGSESWQNWGLFWSEGFPDEANGKEPACQCRRQKRRKFDPWVGKIPGGGYGNPLLKFLPGESHGQRSLAGYGPQGHT